MRLEDGRIREILSDVLHRRTAGDWVSDEEVLAAHPDLAQQLVGPLKAMGIVQAARERASRAAKRFGPPATGCRDQNDDGPANLPQRKPHRTRSFFD